MSEIPENEILEIPNSWKAGVITNKGLGLLSKLITGNTLFITRAETGAGWVSPELLPQQTAVTEPMQPLSFSAVSYPDEGKCMIPCKLTNADVTASYIARQIGLYANDPDEGEILFYITQVEDEEGGTGIPSPKIIPSYSSTWNLVIYYGMADGVDVTVDPAGAVTREEMELYVNQAITEGVTAYSIPEIEAALGLYDGEGGGIGPGGTVVVTLDHNQLFNRNIADQHTIESITGLKEALAKQSEQIAEADEESMESAEIDSVWNTVMGGDETNP